MEGYAYVGPDDIRAAAVDQPPGTPVRSPADLDRWLTARPRAELAEPFTYVVDLTGTLCLAPRRSEHVACASGARVLAAGEIGFERARTGWTVRESSNQSTGYCPDVTCWPALASALHRAGLPAPEGFTHEVVFRRCEGCGERAVVREDDYVCVLCGARLPGKWNFGR
ncbi:hypothetical protein [Streptomyces smaragdinus]|uniref:hypothetical protein n=1 Tax=Streptomyces smaragdinus TaxID=2585196 RepID=UPI002B21C06E|nr:hypothetical protein [Streptomyces smaragdinus]